MNQQSALRELISQYKTGHALFTEPINRAFHQEVVKPQLTFREDGYDIRDILGDSVKYRHGTPEFRLTEEEAWEKYWQHEARNYVADLEALLGFITHFCKKHDLGFVLMWTQQQRWGANLSEMRANGKVWTANDTLAQLAVLAVLLDYTEAQSKAS